MFEFYSDLILHCFTDKILFLNVYHNSCGAIDNPIFQLNY